MAEIGAQLREARTRARIEIAQMEAQTKIRAKYLRALENEEWELLPGPTYVKSFLRTYGDMLGLDGRQLVAEYKSAHEPFQAVDDIGQMSKHTGGRINRQQTGPPFGRIGLIAVLLVAVIGGGAYAYLGKGDDTNDVTDTPVATSDEPAPTSGEDAERVATEQPAKSTTVSVVVAATAATEVCVRAGSRLAVPLTALAPGKKTEAVRGKSVTVTATNRSVRLTVGGKRRALPSGSGSFTVTVTPNGVKRAGTSVTACRV